MKCENCGHEMGDGESIPKSVQRKRLNELYESIEDADVKLKILSELNRLEQYTGANMKRDQKKLGVFIVQNSKFVQSGPGKNKLGDAGNSKPA